MYIMIICHWAILHYNMSFQTIAGRSDGVFDDFLYFLKIKIFLSNSPNLSCGFKINFPSFCIHRYSKQHVYARFTQGISYRPISLTSIICKTAEHIIHSQIIRHLDSHNLLTEHQFGFRKRRLRRSCESQLLYTTLPPGLEISNR